MEKITLFLTIFLLSISCGEKAKRVENTVEKDLLSQAEKDSIDEEKYWGYDTLLISEYTSDNGNRIELRGSLSNFLYQVRVTTNKGATKVFDVAENSYIASHSEVLWDNNDFLFVRYGCGSPCWGGKLLSLNDERKILDYSTYVYEDSVKNIVVYPDSTNWNYIIVENFNSEKKKGEIVDFCEKALFPYQAIDTIICKNNNQVKITYRATDCETIKTKTITVE